MKQMIKRKDGSYSQRGLWDNIRANRGSGKKPTSEMLKQETNSINKKSRLQVAYLSKGGQHGGLDRWFAEKWVDIKTGKDCGRSGTDKDGRPYPACRPSKRINSNTPKTSSEMSSQEKSKFKQSKTSSQRISYNHKRK